MTGFSPQHYPILFRRRWPTTGLADGIEGIDLDCLCAEYDRLRKEAPSRTAAGFPDARLLGSGAVSGGHGPNCSVWRTSSGVKTTSAGAADAATARQSAVRTALIT